jgi:hypothetical protein
MTAIFFHNSRSNSDETTETQPLAGLQGEGGFGSLERLPDRDTIALKITNSNVLFYLRKTDPHSMIISKSYRHFWKQK